MPQSTAHSKSRQAHTAHDDGRGWMHNPISPVYRARGKAQQAFPHFFIASRPPQYRLSHRCFAQEPTLIPAAFPKPNRNLPAGITCERFHPFLKDHYSTDSIWVPYAPQPALESHRGRNNQKKNLERTGSLAEMRLRTSPYLEPLWTGILPPPVFST